MRVFLLAATMIDLQRERFAQQQQAIHEGDQEAQPFDENFCVGIRLSSRHVVDRPTQH